VAAQQVTARQLLKDARQRAGLTQHELADLALTSQSAVAAYESGSRQPTLPVLERMLNAAGFELSVGLVHRPELLRLADLGGLIRDEPDTDRRLRLYFEFLRGADESDDDLLLLLAAEPPTTGDRRYDALLAATAEHLAVHAGLPTPAWALQHDRVIDGFWWVSGLPSARAQAMVHAPASFRRRGVLLARHDLEAA
jgi:transcriptional regulator with XRE-family HTH domain